MSEFEFNGASADEAQMFALTFLRARIAGDLGLMREVYEAAGERVLLWGMADACLFAVQAAVALETGADVNDVPDTVVDERLAGFQANYRRALGGMLGGGE